MKCHFFSSHLNRETFISPYSLSKKIQFKERPPAREVSGQKVYGIRLSPQREAPGRDPGREVGGGEGAGRGWARRPASAPPQRALQNWPGGLSGTAEVLSHGVSSLTPASTNVRARGTSRPENAPRSRAHPAVPPRQVRCDPALHAAWGPEAPRRPARPYPT